MRILVVNNTVMFEKGEGLYIYKETGKFFTDLLIAGNEVSVFQFRMMFRDNDFLADFDISNKGLKIISIKRRKSKIWAYAKALLIGFFTVRKHDFIYLFYPGNICTILALFSIFWKKKFGLYVRGEQGILSFEKRYLYNKANVVFTISPKFTDIINNCGAKAYTIRPMMDYGENDIIRDRTYKTKEKYEILYVGRLEKEKGLYELIDAVHIVINSGTLNLVVNLVGDGDDANVLKRKVHNQNLNKYINFHGTITNRDTLSLFYRNADLFVLATHHEGFPRVLYEAMIFGVPIITTFVGAISYLMKDNYNCYNIKSKCTEDLVLKINEVLVYYENKAKVALNGTETIINYLSDKKNKHAVQLLESINN